MKIISLAGSYRLDGNTNRILDVIENRLTVLANENGISIEIERIQLGHSDIRICRGCRACFDRGEEKCPHKDDLLPIMSKLFQADGIIAASPVYVEDVNGIMKNWIDRMAFLCHRPAFAGKTAYIITTSGMGTSNHARNTILTAFTTWGIKIAGHSRFRMGERMEPEVIESKYTDESNRAAAKLFNAVKNHSYAKPTLYSLIAFKVQQVCWQKVSKHQDTFDYYYWDNHGWLQKDCKYYTPNKAGFMKVKFARMIGTIVASFFI